jgi:hypothetical protein
MEAIGMVILLQLIMICINVFLQHFYDEAVFIYFPMTFNNFSITGLALDNETVNDNPSTYC